jgi:hypothetical protein
MQELIKDVLRYFLDHPDASESVEGIGGWWPAGRSPRPTAPQVRESLNRLAIRGFLIVTSRPGGGQWFRLNTARRREGEAFLRGDD